MSNISASVEEICDDYIERINRPNFQLKKVLNTDASLLITKRPTQNDLDEVNLEFNSKNIAGSENKKLKKIFLYLYEIENILRELPTISRIATDTDEFQMFIFYVFHLQILSSFHCF